MAEYTPNLNLLKKDPATDGNDTFNIETMLNENWDKIDMDKKSQDSAIVALDGKIKNIEIPVTSVNSKTGAVELTVEDIGAETPVGAQKKADDAESAANSYTDQEVGALAGEGNTKTVKQIDEDLKTHKADYRIHPLFVDYTLTNENVAFLSSCSVITLDVQLKELKDGMRFRFKTKRRIGCSYSAGAILIGIPGFTWKLSDSDLNEKGAFLASSSGAIVNELQDGLIYTIRLCMTDTNRGNFFILEDSRDFGTESSNLLSLDNITTPNNKQINVSYKSTASGTHSQVNASEYSTASGAKSQVNASYESTASGARSQVNASENSTANGYRSQVNASSYSKAIAQVSQINASRYCETNGTAWANHGGPVIISGKAVLVDDSCGYGVVAGGGGSSSAIPSTQNRKWQLDSSGSIKASGAITGNSSFADFAEYFESIDGNAIPLGTIVSLAEGGKIKVAQEGDYMVGVISQTAGVILNAQGFEWKDRYLYDRYGQPIYIDKEVENENKLYEMYDSYLKTEQQEQQEQQERKHISFDEYKATLSNIPMTTVKSPMLNPSWDETQKYIPREDRPEWNAVGLTGQIYTNVDETVKEGDFVMTGKDGIATKGRNTFGQNWQVMKITTPYQDDLGHGIAIVFVR